MFESFGNFFQRPPPVKGGPLIREPASAAAAPRRDASAGKPAYSKVFRWRLPDGQSQAPASVEVAGTFNHWQKVALTRDSALDGWHVTIHHIQGNRTHHYALLIDGKPAHDKNCDGLACPHGPEEERFQVMTDKGPRVMMLFAQTK
jgi:hypothetical protein